MSKDQIEVKGARVHNLKNISFTIPHNQITVVTGVSGSGKSSLAFDTVYAEGQRRYVESLSAYARQFLERMEKPDVDEVLGIAPAIAIRQKNQTRNPRSTVATQTEIFDYLRLLFARIGQTFCHLCGNEVLRWSPESAADDILTQLGDGTRFYLLFPVDGAEHLDKLSVSAALMSLMQKGFTRLFLNGETIDLRTPDDFKHDSLDEAYVLVDRLAVKEDIRQRLVDSLEICFRQSGTAVVQTTEDTPRFLKFSDKFVCQHDGTVFHDPEPRLFSFNNPFGACPVCQGFGNTIGIDFNLVIPNPLLTLAEGAIEPWTKPQHKWASDELKEFAKLENIPMNVPFVDLTDEQRNWILEGKKKWRGVRGFFAWLDTKKYKLHVRVFLAKYRGYTVCPDCHGGRLRQEARNVKIADLSLPEVVAMSIKDAAVFFEKLQLSEERHQIAEKLLFEIKQRLKFLIEVGLDYLTLARLASTLSGGEAQRIQLATNLGSSLVGALYVLDEPSIGLHPRDGTRLIKILENLRDIGNTVLVVEHDSDMMEAADHILDIGAFAGELGGKVIFEGNYKKLLKDGDSLTAKYLRGECEIKIPMSRRKPGPRKIKIKGARENNLKNIDVNIPLDMLVCVTGVSGSGKSTLIHDIIYAGLMKQRGEWQGHVGLFKSLDGGDQFDQIVLVDQSPIGRTPRSNPVTYIKAYDAIRELFASTNAAQTHGFDPSHFSFNVPGGRCEVCQGSGTVTVEMQFLSDVELVCEECRGTRFRSAILDVKYKGKNIHDVLNMTVREALLFFKEVPKIANRLKVLDAVGLGYLRLGQSATTLSGGEAQRVKLAAHLAVKNKAQTLYIFDEPTTGLHFDDINKLLTAFRALIDNGGSLIVIEHNLDVIKTADYIIDMGPEGGTKGGEVIATGTPEAIMKAENSHTGHFLKRVMPANGNAKSNGNAKAAKTKAQSK